jgi:hypothetical protein
VLYKLSTFLKHIDSVILAITTRDFAKNLDLRKQQLARGPRKKY